MNIVITGGGTGGHLYPGLEIAKFYYSLGHNVYYIASKNGIDKNIIEEEKDLENIKISYWNLRGIQREINLTNILENTKTVFKLLYLKNYSKKFLKYNKIDLVIGVGGYISYPLVVEAHKLGKYTVIHEQNSYPGLVNRKLANVVNKIGITYNSSIKYFKENESKVLNVSNPRVDVVKQYKNKEFYEELSLNPSKKMILFLGGSLGADTINRLFKTFVNQNKKNYQAVLVSGLKNNENLEDLDLKDNIIIQNTSKLLKYLSTADMVVSRAGATTLLEIIHMEKKSLVIPSPNVVANHQLTNALEFYNQGLIAMLEEENIKDNTFLQEIEKLQKDNDLEQRLKKYNKINSLKKFKDILEDVDDIR